MKSSRRRLKFYIFTVPVLIIIGLVAVAVYVPPASRIIVIGLDAADWDIINPLVDAGRLPNIKRIMDGGATGKLETFEISASPAVWNTISTGVTRDTHGIKGFTLSDTDLRPYTTSMRRVPAWWNIVSHFGGRVGIVGHWVSWPAEVVNGEMVSSFISYDPDVNELLYYKGKLRKDLNIPGQTYPPELIDELAPLVVAEEDVKREDIEGFFDIKDWDDLDLYRKADGSDNLIKESLEYIVPWTYAADKTHVDVFNYLRKNKAPYDVIFTYIEGTDVFAHRFWHFYNTEFLDAAMEYWGYDMSQRDKYVAAFKDSINRYYEWSDKVIGDVMSDMGPRDTLIVVSDHGFGRHYRPEGFETVSERHTFSGTHAHYGVIMLYGANIKKGYKLQGKPPNLTDVMPTMLNLLKLPVAQWIQGRPITDAFTPRFNSTYRLKWIDEYGIEDQFRDEGDSRPPLNPEYERRMRALGYIT